MHRLLFPLITTLAASAGPRVANSTITLPSQPPASVIEVQAAFPGLNFSSPLCLRSPDGETQRLFVCEKGGDLELIPDVTSSTPSKATFLDLDQILTSRGESLLTNSEQGLLSVAFHPNYQNNGHFFIVYNVRSNNVNYQRLSRWHDPNLSDTSADPSSEEILIEMRNDAGNHNGGDLHFGPDGYLYMSWGDEGGSNDTLNNGQFLDKDFWASITRIDVDLEAEDHTPADGSGSDDANLRPNPHPAIKLVNGHPLYEVPADNPWVGATSFNGVTVNPSTTRTEFYAVGLRNPWRFSFDENDLWIADVGQGAREEITLAPIGSNHGWPWYEGELNGPRFNNTISGASRSNSTHTLPIWTYQRGNGEFQGNSVTGGFVYRGSNIPSLTGKYIFSDYISGNIWALARSTTPGEPEVERIAGEGGLAGFGPDPSNGDILMADVSGNQIHRLVARDDDPAFPETLSATGIFSDLVTLTPNPGVVPYEINLPFWSDHALKQRWFALKNTSDLISYSENEPWTFPNGMIWVKHFDLELERGNPATKKRIETRVIVRNQTPELVSSSTLLPEGAAAKYLVPTNASLESTWMTTSFDDATWPSANTGIGYDESSTYLSHFGSNGNLGNSMNGQNTSVYLRVPFQLSNATSLDQLTLRMKYDDGFVAYLNGQRVAAANAPSTLTWQSSASGDHPDSNATSFIEFDLSAFTNLLQDGTNILAIHGLNNGIGSSDMLISPELIGGTTTFTDGIYGVSYKWNEAGTEATLVGSPGEDLTLNIDTPDGVQAQTWNIPSRSACLTCHTPEAGHALSFNTPQLNRSGSIEGSTGNLLALLHSSGYLDSAPDLSQALPRHIGPGEEDYSLAARVRSYLDVNCAYCHQDPGVQPLTWKGNHHLTLDQTSLINGLTGGGIQHPADRLVVPGNPARSILLSRVAASNGYTRMPPLSSNETDAANVKLLTDWILQEASNKTNYPTWRIAKFGNDTSPQGEPNADPDQDGASNQSEYLALTNPNDSSDKLTTNLQLNNGNIEIPLPALPSRRVTIQHSHDLQNWTHWLTPANNAIPRNPAGPSPLLTTPTHSSQEFFRYLIEEN